MSEEEKEAIKTILNLVDKQQQEKKITGEIDISKTIESNIDYWRNKCFEQQKEIEELKDITRAYDGMAGIMPEGHPIIIADKEYFDSGRFIQRYISKDVIEKKIEELEDLLDLAENDTRVAKYKTSALKEEIEDFKDLLR